MMSKDTFFSYKRYKFLIWNLLLLAVLTTVYIIDKPLGGRNGGTVLGYTYGIIAALGIFYLMYYGIRKRSYYARYTTLKGALSAHVWLGITLSVIVPLHCGFSFGVNVHTLAYILMMIVIISGIFGAVAYASLASDIPSHRGAGSAAKHLEQVKLASDNIEDLIKGKSDFFVDLKNKIDFQYKPSVWSTLFSKPVELTDKSKLAELLQKLNTEEQEDAFKLISLVDKKIDLIRELQKEVNVMTKLRLWMYFHLPISFALIAALLIHIFVVFYYW